MANDTQARESLTGPARGDLIARPGNGRLGQVGAGHAQPVFSSKRQIAQFRLTRFPFGQRLNPGARDPRKGKTLKSPPIARFSEFSRRARIREKRFPHRIPAGLGCSSISLSEFLGVPASKSRQRQTSGPPAALTMARRRVTASCIMCRTRKSEMATSGRPAGRSVSAWFLRRR